MARAWASVYSIALGITLFAGDMAFQPEALAQAQSAYQEQIAAFTPKLETARSAQADLNGRVACLNQRDAVLVKERDNLQERLGRLRSKETDLAPKVRTLEAAYDGFRGNFLSEQKKLVGLRRELSNLQAHKRAQEQWIQKCEEEKPWQHLWGLTCRADMDLSKVFGQIKDYEGDISAAAKKEQIARGSMDFARAKLNDGERELTETRNQARDIGAEITRTETAIGNVSKALADIRASVQPFQLVVGEFANALTEAKDVNLADARARTMRKLGDIAANVDAAMVRSTAAVRHADETLGAEWMKTCRVS